MNPAPSPLVSIVVATVDRVGALGLCLDGLARQLDVAAEIIVVVGPGGDETIGRLSDRIDIATVVSTEDRNLARSRNLGIDVARGEFVAFIDDDAYPTEQWLAELINHFVDPEVGGVGGEVFDYTGYTHQARYSRCSRAGDASVSLARPIIGLTETPAASTFAYPIGTNMVFRTDALRSIGGFDEQYDYFHDETDLTRRLLDRGWIVRVADGGPVFHKFLPSKIRGERRIALARRSILINRAYFAARHQAPIEGAHAVRRDFENFARRGASEIDDAIDAGLGDDAVRLRYADDVVEALSLLDGWLSVAPTITTHKSQPGSVVARPGALVERASSDVRHVVFAAPRGANDVMMTAASSLAGAGHVVHVVEIEGSHATVDLEGDLWRHRMVSPLAEVVLPGDDDALIQLTNAIVREVQRISSVWWAIDAVVALDDSPEAIALGQSRHHVIPLSSWATDLGESLPRVQA
ncbi:MAG: glycosyltransferase [Actinomycetes bacterium]